MKVATLSYHNAYNYGAVFQCAALQHVISKLGHECDIINYRNETVENQYAIKWSLGDIRHDIVLMPFIAKKKKNFNAWRASCPKTNLITRPELPQLNSLYDYFVVGSDQVWNMKCHSADTSYFLDFVDENRKKIAYAASFGTYSVPSEFVPLYKKYLPEFEAISVRESRGITLVNELAGKQAKCTLDPVLLVGDDFWLSRMASRKLVEGQYVFVYQLSHSNMIPRFLDALRKEKSKIVFVTGHSGNMIHYRLGDRNCSSVSPEEFLSLLSNADKVVTDSFHATALSILFHKQFYSIIKGKETDRYNSRLVEILREYNLLDCCGSTAGDFDLNGTPDYSRFDELIKTQRAQSLEFLSNSIR